MAFFAIIPINITVTEFVEVVVLVCIVTTTAYVAIRTVAVVDAKRENYQNSSSVANFPLEEKTIYEWWCKGIDGREYEKLRRLGYNVENEYFSLEELKTIIRCETKALGKSNINKNRCEVEWNQQEIVMAN